MSPPQVLELAHRCREFFLRTGVAEVCPPLLEPASTFAGVPGLDEAGLFHVLDGGEVRVLRPDATLPLARRLAAAGAPERPRLLGYVLPVVRRAAGGEAAERWQAGVERVGPPGDADDVGVVRLALTLLAALGAGPPVVVLGHAALLDAALAELVPDADARRALRTAVARRSLAELDAALRAAGGRGARGAALAAALDPLAGPERRQEALAALAGPDPLGRAAAELLDAARRLQGAARVVLDPALVRLPDYYDGLVFEVGVPGGGRPVAGGGRCDGLPRRFGGGGTWAGFAVDLEALAAMPAEAEALPEQRPAAGGTIH